MWIIGSLYMFIHFRNMNQVENYNICPNLPNDFVKFIQQGDQQKIDLYYEVHKDEFTVLLYLAAILLSILEKSQDKLVFCLVKYLKDFRNVTQINLPEKLCQKNINRDYYTTRFVSTYCFNIMTLRY